MVKYYTWRPGEALFVYSAFLLSLGAWVIPAQRVIAMATTLGIVVMLLCIDGRGIVTLRGVMQWGRITYSALGISVFVMILFFPALLAIYFLIAYADYRIMRSESERVVIRRVFAQRIVDVATLYKSDSKKSV